MARALTRFTRFELSVFKAAEKIPRGRISTYSAIAKAIGKPRAARAVGNALNKNPFARVPCHRVVKSDGSVGGFAHGTKKKAALLSKERVEIKKGRILGFKKVFCRLYRLS